ncbi:glycoside hydrolase family 15 protein [Streptomyces sp. AM 4-1-1]|uniref:glycoside hydrolase family 15 protein n=1 Tax=Streptomyces sp. AM 4-1-1 TaxID=3028710 RepID=UPI0023B98D59|nr:glycoside hydrolase family 15 protein [Streptomyces sp. AM 4-1-1]WEH37168.1 glycoside hydrolase family 15 protein [Streptomyces sp. AM 4-1-1]
MGGTPADDEQVAFPPQALRDYALLADGERGALVGPRGEICWLCAPRWHDDSVFSTLIGGPGLYSVSPSGRFVPGGHYESGSLIWRSRWVTGTGIVECREALAFPGEPGRLVLLRRVLARRSEARVRVLLRPVAGYGTTPLRNPRCEDGVWTARLGASYLRWSGGSGARLSPSGAGDGFVLDLVLDAGERHDLVLELSTAPPQGPPVDASRAWAATERAWADAVPALDNTIADRDARSAYAVLRGMTGSDGGMVAAATTSLPERAEEGRNYDYRYVWIRDQCYAGQAVAAAGAHPLLDDAVRFVTARLHADGPRLAPAYTVDGGAVPDQRELRLPGYPGGYGRVGNHVNQQFQLDSFGEALLLLGAAARRGRLDADGLRAAGIAADVIERRWREPDAGIWELDDRAWTHSRLICAAGLRRMAGVTPDDPRGRRWARTADTLLADTGARALRPDGCWQRAPDDSALDASLLMPPLRGLLPADDPRTRATLRAYRRELTDGCHAYRFRHDDRPLEEAEGAFLLCGFVMALAEHQQGHHVEAHRWFAHNREACGAAGLYAEEYDIAQRQLRGNLPQAFVHALMLEASAVLADDGPR